MYTFFSLQQQTGWFTHVDEKNSEVKGIKQKFIINVY